MLFCFSPGLVRSYFLLVLYCSDKKTNLLPLFSLWGRGRERKFLVPPIGTIWKHVANWLTTCRIKSGKYHQLSIKGGSKPVHNDIFFFLQTSILSILKKDNQFWFSQCLAETYIFSCFMRHLRNKIEYKMKSIHKFSWIRLIQNQNKKGKRRNPRELSGQDDQQQKNWKQ